MKLLPAVFEGAAAAGRDLAGTEKMLEIKLSFDTDYAMALENTRSWAPLSPSPEQKAGLEDPAAVAAATDGLPIEQVARR